MKAYEVKFICPDGIDSSDIDKVADEASSVTDGLVRVFGSVVHARPPAKPINRGWEATVMVATTDEDTCHGFGGNVTRLSGLAFANCVEFGKKTLSLKGDLDAVQEQLDSMDIDVEVSDE